MTSSLRHDALGWINVNRGADLNLMHVHTADRWSGTYYVADGGAGGGVGDGAGGGAGGGAGVEGDETSDETSDDGHLLFRAGSKRHVDGVARTSHTFMSIPPCAGTLWLFPGRIPHRVRSMAADDGQPAHPYVGASLAKGAAATAIIETTAARWQLPPRISIAVNLLDAGCTTTTDGETTTERDERNALTRMEGELEEQLTPRKLAELHGWQEEHKRSRPAVYRRLLRELHQRMVEVLAARSERIWYSNTMSTMAPAKAPVGPAAAMEH